MGLNVQQELCFLVSLFHSQGCLGEGALYLIVAVFEILSTVEMKWIIPLSVVLGLLAFVLISTAFVIVTFKKQKQKSKSFFKRGNTSCAS